MAGKKPLLCIGWDIGGWGGEKQGKKQAFAALEWDGKQVNWLSIRTKSLESYLLDFRKDNLIAANWDGYHRVVLAIDAPLGMPKGFVDFVNGDTSFFSKEKAEIYLELGFRTADRWFSEPDNPLAFSHNAKGNPIHHRPLSPVFQAFTNNVTVAMAQLRYWSHRYDIRTVPQEVADTSPTRLAIEVYPALMKSFGAPANDANADRKTAIFDAYAALLARLTPLVHPKAEDIIAELPKMYRERVPKSSSAIRFDDECDAALCALFGLGFLADELGLPADIPRLITPSDIPTKHLADAKAEGWIFHPKTA